MAVVIVAAVLDVVVGRRVFEMLLVRTEKLSAGGVPKRKPAGWKSVKVRSWIWRFMCIGQALEAF